jgi:hypothetical protein
MDAALELLSEELALGDEEFTRYVIKCFDEYASEFLEYNHDALDVDFRQVMM